jgi:hypothetical protein
MAASGLTVSSLTATVMIDSLVEVRLYSSLMRRGMPVRVVTAGARVCRNCAWPDAVTREHGLGTRIADSGIKEYGSSNVNIDSIADGLRRARIPTHCSSKAGIVGLTVRGPVPGRSALPLLGQHSDELLQDLGYSESDCMAFAARGIVGFKHRNDRGVTAASSNGDNEVGRNQTWPPAQARYLRSGQA